MAKSLRKERAKPTLISVGGRQVTSNGLWNDGLLADYVLEHGTADWIKIGELARVGFSSNTQTTKRRARKRLSTLFTELLDRGQLLTVRYEDDHGGASHAKIADLRNAEERQHIDVKLHRMKRNKDISQEVYAKAMVLIATTESDDEDGAPSE